MDVVDWAQHAPPQERFRDLAEADMKEIFTTECGESNPTNHEINDLYEALEMSIGQLLKDGYFSRIYGLDNNHTRFKPSISPIHEELHMGDYTTADEQAYSSSGEDVGTVIYSHLVCFIKLEAELVVAITEDRSCSPEPAWSISSLILTVPTNKLGLCSEVTYTPPPRELTTLLDRPCIRNCQSLSSRRSASPVPNGRMLQTSHRSRWEDANPKGTSSANHYRWVVIRVMSQYNQNFFFNKDLEYLRYGRKIGRPALSILKMKASMTSLRCMVYLTGGFKDNGSTLIDTHLKVIAGLYDPNMRIFKCRHIESLPMYGLHLMKKIVLRRADLKNMSSRIREFKYQQRIKDFQLGIESYQTQLNLTKPRWDAKGFEYKHDFTIDEALDYRVKEFRVNRRNPGLDTQFWTKKDVDRSKEFMFAIQKRLKTRCIFRNLESFVGGRIRDGDYRLLKRTE
ncbi:hypothetical protein Tco_0777905 [Tanacetum coccineum]